MGKGEGRNHDLLMFSEDAVVSIEAKADESLDKLVEKKYYPDVDEKQNQNKRTNGLCEMIYGDGPENHMDIRYQLLTAVAGALIEADRKNLNKAVILVITFKKQSNDAVNYYNENKINKNLADINTFLHSVNAGSDGKFQTDFGKKHKIETWFKEIEIIC